MKKWLALLLLTVSPFVHADTKISAMTSTTTLNGSDIIPVVTNPGTNPANRSITFSNFASGIPVISSAIAFGSSTSTVTSDVTNLSWDNTLKSLGIGTLDTGIGPGRLTLYGPANGTMVLKIGMAGATYGIDISTNANKAVIGYNIYNNKDAVQLQTLKDRNGLLLRALPLGGADNTIIPITLSAENTSGGGVPNVTLVLRSTGVIISSDVYVNGVGNFGNATSTTLGNNPYTIFNASGTSQAAQFNINGRPSGGEQNQVGGITINGPSDQSTGFSPALLVLQDSSTNATNGSGLLELWENNPNHNSYLLWIHGTSTRNSDEPIRFDGPTWGIDEVNNSTDNTHGWGKRKVISSAYQSVDLQLASSRAYDNTTFENMMYAHPFTKLDSIPGLYLRAQDLTNDSGVLASSDTIGVSWYTLNSHIVGLTGPANSSNSYTFGLPDTVGNAGNLWYNSGNRGGNFNVRQMKHTGADFSYLPTTGVTISTVTIASMTVNGSANFTGTGDGGISFTIGNSTYGVLSATTPIPANHVLIGGGTNYVAMDGGILLATQTVTVTISSGTGFNGLSIPVWRSPTNTAVTVVKILAESLGAGTTVLYQLDSRAFGSINSAGTSTFSVAFSTANNTGVTTTSFANTAISAQNSLVLTTPALGASAGSPTALTFTIYYNRNTQ